MADRRPPRSNWTDAELLFPYFVFGTIVTMLMARQLNVIALGDELATSLGQRVERTRLILFATAALLASSAVSVAGLIGFVGLIIPHLVRLVIGNDYRLLLPTSALFGAVLIVLGDTVARTILDPRELPVGVLTAVLGGPVFIMPRAAAGIVAPKEQTPKLKRLEARCGLPGVRWPRNQRPQPRGATKARSWRLSDPTAPANRRCCARSDGCSGRRAASSH